MVTSLWEAYRKSPPGYSGNPSPARYDYFLQNWAHSSQSKLDRTLLPNGARYNGGLYWQPAGYRFPTQQYKRRPRREPFPQKVGSKNAERRPYRVSQLLIKLTLKSVLEDLEIKADELTVTNIQISRPNWVRFSKSVRIVENLQKMHTNPNSWAFDAILISTSNVDSRIRMRTWNYSSYSRLLITVRSPRIRATWLIQNIQPVTRQRRL